MAYHFFLRQTKLWHHLHPTTITLWNNISCINPNASTHYLHRHCIAIIIGIPSHKNDTHKYNIYTTVSTTRQYAVKTIIYQLANVHTKTSTINIPKSNNIYSNKHNICKGTHICTFTNGSLSKLNHTGHKSVVQTLQRPKNNIYYKFVHPITNYKVTMYNDSCHYPIPTLPHQLYPSK